MSSRENKHTVREIFDAIKAANGFKKDSELADFIGISRQNVFDWQKRDSIGDYEKFTNKGFCEFFVRTGNGPMFIEQSEYETAQIAEKTSLQSKEEPLPMVRHYRDLAIMDADTFGEIQTWVNDMEKIKPGFTGWFRLEFQNRFPEFDDWKEKQQKKAGRENHQNKLPNVKTANGN